MLLADSVSVRADPYYPVSFNNVFINSFPSTNRYYVQIEFRNVKNYDVSGLYPILSNWDFSLNGVSYSLHDISLTYSPEYDLYYYQFITNIPNTEPLPQFNNISYSAGFYTLTEKSILPIVHGVTDQVNVNLIIKVVLSVFGISIGIVFLFFGLRKVLRMIMSAYRKGRVST